MISPPELDRALLDLRDRARNLRALSRHNPHAFLEDKQELAKAIDDLRLRAKGPHIRPVPDRSAFQPGTVLSRCGREVRVEVRRKAS